MRHQERPLDVYRRAVALSGAPAIRPVNGELGILDYLAACWRHRGWVAAATLFSALAAAALLAAQPTRYEAAATLALTPPAFGQRVVLLVDWGLLPDGVSLRGEQVQTKREEELLRLTATAPSATAAQAAVERVVVWVNGERRLPEPLPPKRQKPPKPPKPLRPTPQEVAAWRTQLAEVETRLPQMPPTASPYWTSRALALHDRIEAALVPEAPDMPELPDPPDPPDPPRKGEEAVVLQRVAARALAKPWHATVAAAALGGLVALGVGGALGQEWWRLESAKRAGVA